MLQRLLQFILPREDRFYDFLERQATVTASAAQALARIHGEHADAEAVVKEVGSVEKQSDGLAHDLLHALSRTFITPIDREDIQHLSKRLDDIASLTSQAARACVLFGVGKPSKPMAELMDRLVDATGVLAANLPFLRRHAYAELIAKNAEVGRIESDGDSLYRTALSALFHDPAIDAKVILREKEVLQTLERALDRCEQVAETLTNVAVKHA